MKLKILMLICSVSFLSACATSNTGQQPYMGQGPEQEHSAGTDLYNANKKVQQPQSTAWGWMSNPN